jgi:hypothetical protein
VRQQPIATDSLIENYLNDSQSLGSVHSFDNDNEDDNEDDPNFVPGIAIPAAGKYGHSGFGYEQSYGANGFRSSASQQVEAQASAGGGAQNRKDSDNAETGLGTGTGGVSGAEAAIPGLDSLSIKSDELADGAVSPALFMTRSLDEDDVTLSSLEATNKSASAVATGASGRAGGAVAGGAGGGVKKGAGGVEPGKTVLGLADDSSEASRQLEVAGNALADAIEWEG